MIFKFNFWSNWRQFKKKKLCFLKQTKLSVILQLAKKILDVDTKQEKKTNRPEIRNRNSCIYYNKKLMVSIIDKPRV